MVRVKVVCERERVTFTKCHACHAKRRWMSPSATPATPATQNEGSAVSATPATQNEGRSATPAKQSEGSALSATPTTQNEGGCHQMPHLPRETKADVAKCHACHAKRRWMSPNATPAM